MFRLFAILGFVTIASGCASYGAENYGCSGVPNGVTCMSSRDVFNASNSGEKPVQRTSLNTDNDDDSRDKDDREETSNQIRQVRSINNKTDPVLDTFVTTRIPDRPIPIRTPAQVMRIWIASWEDTTSGALMAPGYVYTEVEPRKWVIGKTESAVKKQSHTFNPLELSNRSRLFKK